MRFSRKLLEADRVRWYKKLPVPTGWHEAYARGEAALETYLSINNIRL